MTEPVADCFSSASHCVSRPARLSASDCCVGRERNHDAAVSLFRGMLGGMQGFCIFCAVRSLTLQNYAVATAFALALGAQFVVHGLALWLRQRESLTVRRERTEPF